MTKIDELKAKKKKLAAEKAELQKKVKAKKGENKIPAFMAKEAKY